MRRRAKSMFVETAPKLEDEQWSNHENLQLIRSVFQQIPQNDAIPYANRAEMINWKRVVIDEKTHDEAKQQFEVLLSKIRNYRVLTEMLNDLQKAISAELPLPKKSTAFSLFMEDNKEELKKKVGLNAKKGAFVTVAAEQFKELTEKEKQKYLQRAKEIRQLYDNYLTDNNISIKSKKKMGIFKAEPVISPITCFWEHKKKNDPTITFTAAKKLYTSLDKSRKLKYILEFLEVEGEEKLNMQQFKMAENMLTKEELSIIGEYEGRPKKLSAYQCYMKDAMFQSKAEADAGENPSKVFRTVAADWKNLSEKEKAKYNKMSEGMQKNYVNEFLEFVKSLPADRQFYEMNKVLSKELHKVPKQKRKRKEDTKWESQDEEVVGVIDVSHNSQKRDDKDSTIFTDVSKYELQNEAPSFSQATSFSQAPSFSQASTSSPRKKHKPDPYPQKETKESNNTVKNVIKREPEHITKKLRKANESMSEDTDNQGNESSSSIITGSQFKTGEGDFPTSALKYYVHKLHSGPKAKAKRAYKRLNFEEKEEVAKKYEKAKKKYLKSIESQFKSPLKKIKKNSLSQSEISNEDLSDFDFN